MPLRIIIPAFVLYAFWIFILSPADDIIILGLAITNPVAFVFVITFIALLLIYLRMSGVI